VGSRHPLRAHLAAVAALAVDLARRHAVDPRRAALAAWLHDRLKPLPPPRLRRLLARYHGRLDAESLRYPVLWHGPAAAAWARAALGVTDRAVLDAVRWHTTGRPGMTPLDQVLFVADACAAGRAHAGAATGRRLARVSLRAGARYVAAAKLGWLFERGVTPHAAALATWRDLAPREGPGA